MEENWKIKIMLFIEPLSSFPVNHSKSVCRNEIPMNTCRNCILSIILHPGIPILLLVRSLPRKNGKDCHGSPVVKWYLTGVNVLFLQIFLRLFDLRNFLVMFLFLHILILIICHLPLTLPAENHQHNDSEEHHREGEQHYHAGEQGHHHSL